ncbi:MAG: hypothetical protein K2Z81_26905, partial [Cyanobacteria bacterium]|nr:hypothetical protein [Cyanobacteriota bacterium]
MEAQQKLSDLLEHPGTSEEQIAAARKLVLEERKKLHFDTEFSAMKSAFAAERNTLSPGEHFVAGPDSQRVKVIVTPGSSVSMAQVNAILARVSENGIKPDEIRFSQTHPWLGTASQEGMVIIRTRGEDIHYLPTFNHESGHLLDFKLSRISPEAVRTTEIWKDCVRDAGARLHERAGQLKDRLPEGGAAGLVREIIDSPAFKSPENDKLIKYFASQEELFAEMYSLYRHEQRVIAQGKERPSYSDLLKEVTSRIDPRRADIMMHFEKMYDHLRATTFNDFSIQNAARERFLSTNAGADLKELQAAFTTHGGGSREFRETFEKLTRVNAEKARTALVDTIFAREHGLDPATFNPTKLTGEQAREYHRYQAFTRDGYDPRLDSSLPDSARPSVEKAFKAYKNSLAPIEALSARRTDAVLKDITRTHLRDFMAGHARGLREDVSDAWHTGIDRIDPMGDLEHHYEARRAHRLSEDEVMSDLYRAYLRKESLAAKGKTESFDDLLRHSLGDARAQELANFPELWRKLNKDVFPQFKRSRPAMREEPVAGRATPAMDGHPPARRPASAPASELRSIEPPRHAATQTAIDSIKNDDLSLAWYSADGLDDSLRTPAFKQAVEERIIRELKKDKPDLLGISDLAAVLKGEHSQDFSKSIAERIRQVMADGTATPDSNWTNLARTLGIVDDVKDAVAARVRKELTAKNPMPMEDIFKLSKEFGLLTDPLMRRDLSAKLID